MEATAPPLQAAGPQGHVVLLVDDEREHVRALAAILRQEFRVLTAFSGREAIGILDREPVHVILSDQRMPDMSGVEFLARAKSQQPDAVRLLCTGFTDINDAISAINDGHVFRYLTKPITATQLQATLREACERYDVYAERKQLLVQLQRKNDELERANEQLRQVSALRTNFIRVASHELRTPLTILLGLARLTSQLPGLAGGVKDKVLRIRSAAERLQHLVDQLLSMLSAERFDSEVERRPTDLGVLLKQAAEDVRPFVDLRHQALVLHVAEDLGTLHLDPEKIRDSLNHLLLNAIKFTPDRGTITLEGRLTGAEGPGVVIRISDTGVGMSPEHMKHLFEPFFTGHDVSRHASGVFEFNRQGIGLGLSVVKAFLELHGGRIRVDSLPGLGSTFEITLPK
jgi:signal transduction histidine kinase